MIDTSLPLPSTVTADYREDGTWGLREVSWFSCCHNVRGDLWKSLSGFLENWRKKLVMTVVNGGRARVCKHSEKESKAYVLQNFPGV